MRSPKNSRGAGPTRSGAVGERVVDRIGDRGRTWTGGKPMTVETLHHLTVPPALSTFERAGSYPAVTLPRHLRGRRRRTPPPRSRSFSSTPLAIRQERSWGWWSARMRSAFCEMIGTSGLANGTARSRSVPGFVPRYGIRGARYGMGQPQGSGPPLTCEGERGGPGR